MKLEEEIKQKEFRNDYQKSVLNLFYTASWLLEKLQLFFDRFGITFKQYNVLRILRGQYPDAISTSEIRTRMVDKSSDASRIVDRLASRGLVTKKTCPGDKRLVDIGISRKGLDLLIQIDACTEELDRITYSISTEEARELSRILDKIRE